MVAHMRTKIGYFFIIIMMLCTFFCASATVVTALGDEQIALVSAKDGIGEVRIGGKGQASKTLKVMDYNTNSNLQFEKQYGIAVETVDRQGDTALWDVSQAMATQDGSIDIFCIRTDDGISLIKEKNYFVDLRASEILSASLTELYPAFASAAETQSKAIAAWPVYAEPKYRTVETELLVSYGFSLPRTWMELLDLIPQILDSDMLSDENCTLFDTLTWTKQDIFPYFVENYILAAARRGISVDFDTELFRTIAQRILSELTNENPITVSGDGEETVLFPMSCIADVIHLDMLPPLALTDEEEAGIYTSAMMLVVNPYSTQQAEAMAYLEYLAQRKEETDYSLYASMTQPKENQLIVNEITKQQEQLAATADNEQKKRLQADIDELEKSRYLVSREAIVNYQKLAKQFVVPQNMLPTSSGQVRSLIERTVAGNLPLNGFIRQANEYYRRIEAE